MKKYPLLVVLVLFFTSAYSQIKFEKGYFIDNDGNKVECLIKNQDWRKNPTEFEYKSDETAESKRLAASLVKEFRIDNGSKYISRTVNIDRSSAQIGQLSNTSNPVFKEEKLFLKVLMEGKANLYGYEDENVTRFFYNVDDAPVEQLIFKKYIASSTVGNSNKMGENNRFRQQLWNSLSCSTTDKKRLENMNYERRALMKIFASYNACSGSPSTTFESKVERQVFALNIRPRVVFSSLNAHHTRYTDHTFDWGGKTNFSLGIEAEYFLPVNKNKWSLILEPTYYQFSAKATTPEVTTSGSGMVGDMQYTSIEIPLGIRHYFFLNDNSRIFVNGSFAFDFVTSSSTLNITRPSGYQLMNLEIRGGSGVALGAGFKHKALGIEFRYNTPRNPLNHYMEWKSTYNATSIVLSYSILRKKS